MKDKKLTDNEIKKALEEQVNDKMCEYQRYEVACGVWCSLKGISCDDMSGKRRIDNCKEYLPVPYIVRAKATLDLINRLQAENESLKNAYKQCTWERDAYIEIENTAIAEAKAEAYTEFAERLKEMSEHFDLEKENFVSEEVIDNLLKEMVGEDNA